MILGTKPLCEMTQVEMHEAIENLRASREALRNEALAQKAVREAKGIAEPRAKKQRVPKAPNEADVLAAQMLAMMRGE